jgi:TPR repeat protein
MIESAKSGNVGAMNELGAIYESGVGAQRNLPVAFQWYRLAAQADDPIGQFNVANMYARGIGVPADIVRAWAYYRRAASNGV